MANPFDEAAEAYDAVRPGYPAEMFDDIDRVTGLNQGSKVLEVGCGTGQATMEFAKRGYRVLCVEPGGSLRELAERRLRGYPAEFSPCRFEDWPPQEGSFDLVASGTAWHWVDPGIGFRKAAASLKQGGYIALFWNLHPTPYMGFFQDVQEVYGEVVPEWRGPAEMQTTEQRIAEIRQQICASGLFEEPTVKTYRWARTFNSHDYIRLLDTYSDHRALPEDRRTRLYTGIKRMIDERFGCSVERPYLTALFLARNRG
jgi:SAM-dependent methyltransferase